MSNYQTLMQQKAELDARIAEAMNTERAAAVAQARSLIQEYQLTEQDVFSAAPAKERGAVGEPKFRNPETGVTWTGRGKQPSWIVGKDRAAFVI